MTFEELAKYESFMKRHHRDRAERLVRKVDALVDVVAELLRDIKGLSGDDAGVLNLKDLAEIKLAQLREILEETKL